MQKKKNNVLRECRRASGRITAASAEHNLFGLRRSNEQQNSATVESVLSDMGNIISSIQDCLSGLGDSTHSSIMRLIDLYEGLNQRWMDMLEEVDALTATVSVLVNRIPAEEREAFIENLQLENGAMGFGATPNFFTDLHEWEWPEIIDEDEV